MIFILEFYSYKNSASKCLGGEIYMCLCMSIRTCVCVFYMDMDMDIYMEL